MEKQLNEMTHEELWQLFPIILTDHNPEWASRYKEEEMILHSVVGKEHIKRISHIGSTAVPGLIAKPTIDILMEVKQSTPDKYIIDSMINAGYIYSAQPRNPAPHMMFMKGYTPEGFKGQAFHVHVRYPGDYDEIRFRDYLLSHPDAAKEYGELKVSLKEKYEHDRDGYTFAKTGFIRRIVELARNSQADSF